MKVFVRHASARCLAAVLVVFFVFLALGVSSPADAQTLQEYRLGPGDRLGIVVFGQDDVSGEFQIDGLGRISMPLLGQIDVRNLTVSELQDQVTRELDESYIVDPRVTVEVLNYRPFYIYGQVNKPGSYPYVSGMTVRQAIILGGGFTKRAREEPVLIIRYDETGSLVEFEEDLNAPVLPGDTIEVDRRLF